LSKWLSTNFLILTHIHIAALRWDHQFIKWLTVSAFDRWFVSSRWRDSIRKQLDWNLSRFMGKNRSPIHSFKSWLSTSRKRKTL
jgi:hypothetical protein